MTWWIIEAKADSVNEEGQGKYVPFLEQLILRKTLTWVYASGFGVCRSDCIWEIGKVGLFQ